MKQACNAPCPSGASLRGADSVLGIDLCIYEEFDMTIRTITTALIAATAFSAPSFALEAMRCNVQTEPGLFQPVLRIVTQGKMEDIRMGEQGLTRTMFYRDAEVLSFVAAKMDMPQHLMPGSVSGICGAVDDPAGFQGGNGVGGAVAVAAPPVGEPIVTSTPLSESDFTAEQSEGDLDSILSF